MMLTDTQRLARTLDARMSATPRDQWPAYLEDARAVLAHEWDGDVDGTPACPDCRRTARYGSHVCSCPTGKLRKRMRGLL